jgi:hypothetical protein
VPGDDAYIAARMVALLDCTRPGYAIVVVGIDRLRRSAAEVMTTIRELGGRGIVLRSLREGIDTTNPSGRMIAGVLATLCGTRTQLRLRCGRTACFSYTTPRTATTPPHGARPTTVSRLRPYSKELIHQ